MPDLTGALLPRLQSNRLPGLEMGGDFIFPAYDGLSLLNLPASICRWLGAPPLAGAGLDAALSASLPSEVRRVLLLVLDGMGLELMRAAVQQPESIWAQLVQLGLLAPITSVSPSTTTTALTTLWTGAGAAAHGIAGYELWLKEYGLVANMISHAPMSMDSEAGSLRRTGFVPEDFLPVSTLGTHLRLNGVEPLAFMHQSIARSGLSAMHLQDCRVHAFRTPADLWVSLRHQLERSAEQREYIYAYWGDLDTLAHRFGPQDERVAAEFDAFSATFAHAFLEKMSPTARGETLLLVTADHGLIHTPLDERYHLQNHPRLLEMLHIKPTGENRLAYLHIRPGCVVGVQHYFEAAWPGEFDLLDTQAALDAGLFGGGARHAAINDRLGDLVVAARGQAYLWWAPKENHLVGRHGGLSPAEMLVPLLAVMV